MICPICGSRIDDASVFCNICGSKMEPKPAAPDAGAPAVPETKTAGAAPEPSGHNGKPAKPAKRGKKGGAVLVAVIAAVCLALAITLTVTAVTGGLANSFAKLTKNDAEYVQWLFKREKNALLTVRDNLTRETEEEEKITEHADLALTEKGKKVLYDLGADPEDIGWIGQGSLDVSVNNSKKSEASEITVGASLNGTDLGEGSVFVDNQNGNVFVVVPEYLSETVEWKNASRRGDFYPSELLTQLVLKPQIFGRLGSGMTSDLLVGQSYLNLLLNSEDGREVLSTYLDAAFENLNRVKKTDATLKASGVSQECEKYTVRIDYHTVKNCSERLLRMALGDEKLRKVFSDYAEQEEEVYRKLNERYEIGLTYDAEEETDKFFANLEDLQEDLEDFEESDFPYYINYVIYVDSHGRIIGREAVFAHTDDDGEKTKGYEVKLYFASEKSGFGIDLQADEVNYRFQESHRIFRIKGTGTVSGDRYSGDLTLYTASDEKFCKLGYEDVNPKKFARGELNGTFTLRPMDVLYEELDELPQGLSVTVVLSGSRTDAGADLTVKKDSDELGTVRFTYTVGKGKGVTVPESGIDGQDDFTDCIDYQKIRNRLTEADVPEGLINTFTDSIG